MFQEVLTDLKTDTFYVMSSLIYQLKEFIFLNIFDFLTFKSSKCSSGDIKEASFVKPRARPKFQHSMLIKCKM